MNKIRLTTVTFVAALSLLIVSISAPVFGQSKPVEDNLQSAAITLFEHATQQANLIKDEDRRERTLSFIAKKYAETREFNRAISLTERISNGLLKSEALLEIAFVMWEKGELQRATLLIEQVKKQKSPDDKRIVEEFEKSIIEEIIKAYARTNQYPKAIELSEDIKDVDNRSKAIYIILDYFISSEKGEIPQTWLNSVLLWANNIVLKSEIVPDYPLSSPQEKESFEKSVREMRKRSIRELTWKISLAYAKTGNLRRAEELANQVGDAYNEDGVWHSSSKESALGYIAYLYATLGKDEDSFRVASSFSGEIQDKTWLKIAEQFALKGKSELAKKALARVIDTRKQSDFSYDMVYASAAVIYKQLGDDATCEQLLRKAIRIALEMQYKSQGASVLGYIANCAAAAGKHELMIEALRAKKNSSSENYMSTLGIIGMTAAKKKQYESVNKILLEIESITDNHNHNHKVSALTQIIGGYIETGEEKEKVYPILKSAVAFHKSKITNTNLDDLARLAIALVKIGRPDMLTELAETIVIPERGTFAYVLAELGAGYAKHGWKLDEKQISTLKRLTKALKCEPSGFPSGFTQQDSLCGIKEFNLDLNVGSAGAFDDDPTQEEVATYLKKRFEEAGITVFYDRQGNHLQKKSLATLEVSFFYRNDGKQAHSLTGFVRVSQIVNLKRDTDIEVSAITWERSVNTYVYSGCNTKRQEMDETVNDFICDYSRANPANKEAAKACDQRSRIGPVCSSFR